MNKRLKRRDFIGRLSLAAISALLLGGCTGRGNSKTSSEQPVESSSNKEGSPTNKGGSPTNNPDTHAAPSGSSFQERLEENRKLPRNLVLQLLDQKVDQYMQLSHHCAQSSFLALKDQFGLGGEDVVKALTPLTGIAERGETCGAVTGPLMALGLIYGRGQHQLGDWDTYRESLVPSGTFCSQFEEEYGSTMCHDIQQVKFGKCFHLTNPDELAEFQEADATEHCSSVVRSAVRMAANLILDDPTL